MLGRLGLPVLIFLAGYETRFDQVKGDTLARSTGAWPASHVLGLAIGTLLSCAAGRCRARERGSRTGGAPESW